MLIIKRREHKKNINKYMKINKKTLCFLLAMITLQIAAQNAKPYAGYLFAYFEGSGPKNEQ
ncbi:MAG: hypothetical protein ACMV0Y_02260, partial [Paludibacter sp.]